MLRVLNVILRVFTLTEDEQVRTYGDVSRKEDVLELVENLSPKENYFLNNLGKTVATDMVHITMTDTLNKLGVYKSSLINGKTLT